MMHYCMNIPSLVVAVVVISHISTAFINSSLIEDIYITENTCTRAKSGKINVACQICCYWINIYTCVFEQIDTQLPNMYYLQ